MHAAAGPIPASRYPIVDPMKRSDFAYSPKNTVTETHAKSVGIVSAETLDGVLGTPSVCSGRPRTMPR